MNPVISSNNQFFARSEPIQKKHSLQPQKTLVMEVDNKLKPHSPIRNLSVNFNPNIQTPSNLSAKDNNHYRADILNVNLKQDQATPSFNMVTGAKKITDFSAVKHLKTNDADNQAGSVFKTEQGHQPEKVFKQDLQLEDKAKFKLQTDADKHNFTVSNNNPDKQITLPRRKSSIDNNPYLKYIEAQRTRQIDALKSSEKKYVAKAHLQLTVGNEHIGLPNYSYRTGADGKNYVVAVSINTDVAAIQNSPVLTIRKMQSIYNVALSPANPTFEDVQLALQSMQVIKSVRLDQFFQTMKQPTRTENVKGG